MRPENQTANVRELLAFVPFYVESLLEDEDPSTFRPMFESLFEEAGFAAPYGLTSAERRSPCFNYSWEHGDTWNQNSWPYETSRLLTGVAHLLQRNETSPITIPEYLSLFRSS